MKSIHHEEHVRIGLNILHFRKMRGLTQLQLAELANYSRNYIQQIETASASPSVDALLDIAKALDIPVEKLFQDR